MKIFANLILSMFVYLGLSSMAIAQVEGGSPTILIGAGAFFTDSARQIDDSQVIDLGIGYIIDKHWAIEALYSEVLNAETNAGVSVDGDALRIDGLYHFDESAAGWIPYLAAGLGNVDFDTDASGSDGTALNFGGGVKRWLGENVMLRGDLRAIQGLDESNLDTVATLALNFVLNGRSSTATSTSGGRDSDGDGVPDRDDQCPDTPAGTNVNSVGCADADGDGVTDSRDECPNTPVGQVVNSVGCPLDSDGDGVSDVNDDCPDTPAGARVDENGCQYVISERVSVELEVFFDTDKSEVKPQFFAEIKRVADFMTLFPSTEATIEGHADARGDDEYNLGLSQRRADAVRQVLIDEHRITADRLKSVGYGETRPRADNDSVAGMNMNRRVMAEIATVVDKTEQ